MSLNVYLTLKDAATVDSGIFIRDDGAMRNITRAEWDERYPNREPVYTDCEISDEVYSANITHNLNKMADAAGIYKYLWRPDELGITKARQLVEPLTAGLALLQSDPERFKKFNPANGWGTYDGLVDFVCRYLDACKENLDADVSVSR